MRKDARTIKVQHGLADRQVVAMMRLRSVVQDHEVESVELHAGKGCAHLIACKCQAALSVLR